MAKLKLDPNPTFARKVTFKSDEGDADVLFKFRHKTRIEFSEFWELHRKARPVSVDDENPDNLDIRAVLEWQTDFLLGIAESWDVVGDDGAPVALDRDSAFRFLNNIHDAYGAIAQAYGEGLQRAKLGNLKG